MKSIWLVGLITVIPGTLVAQEAAQTNNEIEEVVVQAHPLSAEGLAQPRSYLKATRSRAMQAAASPKPSLGNRASTTRLTAMPLGAL